MLNTKVEELAELIQKAQQLGQAFETSADKLSAFAINARNSIIGLSGATEEERKKISQLYAELEKKRDVFKEMKDDYTSAYIIAKNYYNFAKMAGKDVSGLEKMNDQLTIQYDQLKQNLGLLKSLDEFMPERKMTSAQTGSVSEGGIDYTPSSESIQKDLDSLDELKAKLVTAGDDAKALGQKVVESMTESKMSTAEGRKEIAGLVAEFNAANQKYTALATKFNSAQLQLVSGLEAFESKNGAGSADSFEARLERTTNEAYELDKALKTIQTTITSTTRTSPDLVMAEDKSEIIKKNAKAKKELNTVFSEENRILQENRALLAQDQEYVKQKAIVDTAAEGSVRQMVAQMKLYKMELENLSPSVLGNREAMNALKDKINELDMAIKQSSAEQKKHIIDISQYGQTTAYVASDIRRAIQALTQLRVSMGQVDTSTEEGKRKLAEMVAEYRRLTQEIGSLKREYNTIKTTTQALGSQAGIVANVGSMMNAAVYSTQALTGAINLAGGSTSEWGQALVKLQSIMAITNGLTMTYNSLLKTGRIYTLAENATLKITTRLMGIKNAAKATEVTAEGAATTAKIAGTAAQTAENIATAEGVINSEAGATAALEHAAAEEVRAGAIVASTTATKAFNLAMKAGPLIILTAIIGLVTWATKAFTSMRMEMDKLLDNENKKLKQTSDLLTRILEQLDELNGRRRHAIEIDKSLAEATHQYYTEIQQIEQELWAQDAAAWFDQLNTAMSLSLKLSDKLKAQLAIQGGNFLSAAEYVLDKVSGRHVLVNIDDELADVAGLMDAIKRKTDETASEVERWQLELDKFAYYTDDDLKKVADVELTFQLFGERRRMTLEQVQKRITAELESATTEHKFYLNLETKGLDLLSQNIEMYSKQQRERWQIENTVLQAQNDAQAARAANIEQRFRRDRAVARANAKAEIDQLKYRIKTEENLGTEGVAALNAKIGAIQTKLAHDIREINEQEAQAQLEAIRATEDLQTEAAFDSHALRMSLLKQEHDRAVEDLNIRLSTEQDLTATEIQELKRQRELWDDVYEKRRVELERELQLELIDAEKSRYETRSEIAKEVSEEELNYTKQALEKELESELIARQQLTEEERALYATEAEIRVKYARAIAEAEMNYNYNSAKEIYDARARWEKALFNQRKHGIRETAKFEMEQQVAALELERKKYAEQFVAEAKLIALQVELGIVTEEQAKNMFAELDPIVLTIEAIDREIQNLKDNWDKDLEYNNIWEMMGLDKKRAASMETFLDSLKDSLQEALDAWADYYAEKAQLAEDNLDEAKSEYEAQQELRAQGYANSVETARKEMEEKRRLRNQAVREQKQAERAQEEINTAQAISEMAVAVAKVFKDFGWPMGAIMSAAMITAFVGAKVAAARAAKASAELYREGTVELLEGGSHASGKDISLGRTKDGRERRAEGGEFLAIINKRNSRKYRTIIPEVINSLNSGTFDSKFEPAKTSSARSNPSVDYSFARGKAITWDRYLKVAKSVSEPETQQAEMLAPNINIQTPLSKDPTFITRHESTFSRVKDLIDSAAISPVAPKAVDLSTLESEVKSIRKQGETQVYIDEQGNRVETRKGITRKIYKR